MNRKLFGMSLVLALVFSPAANAGPGGDEEDWDRLISTYYTILPTIFPFVLSGLTTDATEDGKAVPAKKIMLKVAAVEVAQYLNGAEPGPFLNAIAAANPDQSLEFIVDAVLEAAEGL